jgi:hypothetical protein
MPRRHFVSPADIQTPDRTELRHAGRSGRSGPLRPTGPEENTGDEIVAARCEVCPLQGSPIVIEAGCIYNLLGSKVFRARLGGHPVWTVPMKEEFRDSEN